jgi:hypothetical protein
MGIIGQFKSRILGNCCTLQDADIILTTTHAAKGMEWDTVQVCDDFISLAEFNITRARNTSNSQMEYQCQFNCPKYADEINLWYVATTRAKKVLAVPPKFTTLLVELEQLDNIQKQYLQENNIMDSSNKRKYSCGGQAVTMHEVLQLYKQLNLPCFQELKQSSGLFIYGSPAAQQINVSMQWLYKAIWQHTSTPQIAFKLIRRELLLSECLSRGLVFSTI